MFVSLDACHINEEGLTAPISQNSLLDKCAEGRKRLERHSLLTIDCQYNVSTGANWESSSVTDNTALEKFYCDETTERPFRLYPVQANER